MDTVLSALSKEWDALLNHAPRMAAALVAVLLCALVGHLAARLLRRSLRRRMPSRAHIGFFGNLLFISFLLAGVVVALAILGLEGIAAGLLTSGGLVAVVMAFAFRQIGENLLSGLFLAFSCPFEVGNFVATGGVEGEVRSVELRYTHIRTPDGRDIYVPNGQIMNEPLVNYTRDGLRRFDCRIGVDYADDAASALGLMAAASASVDGVLDKPPPLARVRELAAQTVQLSLLYWVDVFRLRRSVIEVQSEVNDRVRRAIVEAGFTVSSSVSTAVEIRSPQPFAVHVERS